MQVRFSSEITVVKVLEIMLAEPITLYQPMVMLKNYSGVSLDSFVKKITIQKLTSQGIQNLGPTIEIMAAAEQLDAHKNAVSIRLKKLQNG